MFVEYSGTGVVITSPPRGSGHGAIVRAVTAHRRRVDAKTALPVRLGIRLRLPAPPPSNRRSSRGKNGDDTGWVRLKLPIATDPGQIQYAVDKRLDNNAASTARIDFE